MKKLSLMLVFVALLATLFAVSAFAASFVRGPENDVITWDDIESTEYVQNGDTIGVTTKGEPKNMFDSNYKTYWGAGPEQKWPKFKIVFKNEWELKKVEASTFANWAYIGVTFYTKDGAVVGKQYGLNVTDSSCLYGEDATGKAKTDFTASVNGVSYGDNAIKYMIIDVQSKWGYLPNVYEMILTGQERIPSTGCDVHKFEKTVVSDATCTEDGQYMNVCSACGAKEGPYTIPALGHNIGDYEVVVPATCVTAPTIRFTCTREDCGETIERDMHIQDVTDFADKATIATTGAGGWTTDVGAMFDNDINDMLQVNSSWVIESSITLDMPYYITSATVWVSNLYWTTASHGAKMTLYYMAPGETEWQVAGTKQTPSQEDDVKYAHTLELETPVYASAIKIRVDGLMSSCGEVYEAEVAGSIHPTAIANNHNWQAAGDAVAPTCSSWGYIPYTCLDCGATKQDNFEKASEDYHAWQDATCETPKTCSICNKTEGEALGHNYVAGEQAEDGSITYTCANNCGNSYVINNSAVNGEYFLGTNAVVFLDGVLTAMGNTYSYENNLTTGMITTDDETMYFQVIEGKIYHKGAEVLHQHNEETLIVETTDATCTEDGKTVTTCPFCGILSEETIKAEGHIASWSETREYVSATCMTEGYEKDICEVCKEEYTVVFPVDTVFGHREIWGTGVGEDATCISDGYYSYQCEICEETITDVYPANEDAHVWDQDLYVFVPATCVAGGYSYNKCSLCGTEVTEEFEPSEWAHDYDDGVANNGVIVYTCTLCGNTEEEELDPALPYGDITVEIIAGEYGWTESVYYSVSVPGNYVLTIKNEASVYVVYSDGSELIETSTFAFTLAGGESITFSVMTPDFAAGTVELNLASADNAMLNGTYVTPDGSALFVFADGALTVTDTNEMMPSGFAGEYTYNYNSVTGEVAVDPSTLVLSAGLDMGGNTQIYVFGRMPLKAYVPPMDVVLGDNEITVTNTNYFFDGIKVVFTATEAGKYVITASETGEVLVEGMYGSEMVDLPYEVELAEGQAFEFIVTSSADAMTGENDTVVVTIAKAHVHTEEIIPAVPSTSDANKVVTPGKTSGVKCSECGEILVAPEVADIGFNINGRALNISESLKIIYRNYVPAGYENVRMVINFRGNTYEIKEYTIDEKTGRYCFDFTAITPQYMNVNIEAWLLAEKDGKTVAFIQEEYSIKTYCLNNLAKSSSSDNLKTLLTDLLIYGEMLQKYVGGECLNNGLITEGVDLSYASTYTELDASYDKRVIPGMVSEELPYWSTATLYIANSVSMKFKFYAQSVEGLEIKATVKGRTTTFDADDFVLGKDGRYEVTFTNVTALEFDETVVADFYLNGEKIEGTTLEYTINSYVQRNQNYNNATLVNFLKALNNYGRSAYRYVNG